MGHEPIEHFPNTEVPQSRPEVNGGLGALEKGVGVKAVTTAGNQLHLVPQRLPITSQGSLGRIALEALDDFSDRIHTSLPLHVKDDLVPKEVVNAFEVTAHADGPGNRRTLNSQDGLHLIKKLDGVANFPVELIDEGENRGITQATYFQELDRSRFDALGAVDHHERRVHGSEGTVGIFGEVFVPGRIEQIHDGVPIRELHHRGGHGDPPLLLQGHPIRGGMAIRLPCLDRTRQADRAPEQQKLFRDRRFTGVRVGNDRKGATPGHFSRLLGHEKLPETRIGMGLGEAPCRRHCRRGRSSTESAAFPHPHSQYSAGSRGESPPYHRGSRGNALPPGP